MIRSALLLIHHSSLIIPRFGLLGGCKFSTKRSGVGNVRLVEDRESGAERVVNQTLGGGGERLDERGVVRLEGAEGALFKDGHGEAVLVNADERDAERRRVGDDEPLAREAEAAVELDDAQVGVARGLPVRLAEDI